MSTGAALAEWPAWEQSIASARAELGGYDPAWADDPEAFDRWSAQFGDQLAVHAETAVRLLSLPATVEWMSAWQQAFVEGRASDMPALATIRLDPDGVLHIDVPLSAATPAVLTEAREHAARIADLVRRARGVGRHPVLVNRAKPIRATEARQQLADRKAAWVQAKRRARWTWPRVRAAWPAEFGPVPGQRTLDALGKREIPGNTGQPAETAG